jgi:hypothetical protein
MSSTNKIDDLHREIRFQDALVMHEERCVRLNRSIRQGELCLERLKRNLKNNIDG